MSGPSKGETEVDLFVPGGDVVGEEGERLAVEGEDEAVVHDEQLLQGVRLGKIVNI